jgi:hypothetical protein
MGRTDAIPSWLRRTGIELLGWGLIAVGLAALVLPGPGLLALAGGLVVLSLRYAWAKRLLVPIKVEALKIVEKEVQTWPRIVQRFGRTRGYCRRNLVGRSTADAGLVDIR